MMLEDIDCWREATVWTTSTIAEATKDWFKYLDNNDSDEKQWPATL